MLRFLLVVLMNIRRAPYLITQMRKMIRHPERYSEKAKYAFVQKMVRYLKSSGQITTEVYGKENLPSEGGYVMYPNHQGKYDALGIIYAHREPCSFVMDKAKSYSFLVREFVDVLGAKRLELDNVRQNLTVITEITKEVSSGKRFILFSEGGYDHNRNHVQEFKPGSFKCSVKSKTPIVPVALIDSYKPFNSFSFGPVTTKVIFLEPITYDVYKDLKTPEIAQMVRSRIVSCMEEFGIDAS